MLVLVKCGLAFKSCLLTYLDFLKLFQDNSVYCKVYGDKNLNPRKGYVFSTGRNAGMDAIWLPTHLMQLQPKPMTAISKGLL